MRKRMIIVLSVGMILLLSSCMQKESVTVYTSVDRSYSELVFKDFEEKTGIRVLPVYDTEASKTTGLVNRLIEERKKPVADVFWNGEFSQTLLLKEKGVLKPYTSPSSHEIPDNYKDKEGYWTSFGGRARCILVNTDLLAEENYPKSFEDFLSPTYDPNKIAIANPIFGTTATHAAALFSISGEEEATAFYQAIKDNGIRVVDGNGVVRDLVANGTLLFGMTDTDDAIGAIKDNKPVKILFPDQGPEGIGTLIIPNSAALIQGAKEEENAKIFLDYLLSLETEQKLIEIGWTQVSTRKVDTSMPYFDVNAIKAMDISLEQIYQFVEESKTVLTEVFIR